MSQRYPFQTMTLGFGLSSLSPYCDPDTLYLHHGQYYAQKVRELNHLVSKHRFTNLSLEELLTQDINMPAVQLARLKGAAGAVYNHQLYFDSISCKAGQPPVNRLTEEIAASYGSMDRFRRLMTEAAESIIGSGWVWLVAEGNKGIHITTTPNNEVAPLASVTPVLIADLWEHAYLSMDHFNKPSYMEDWFSLINWSRAEERYLSALGTASVG